MEIQFTQHARDVIAERALSEAWVMRALREPERTEEHPDGTRHHLIQIAEHGGRTLRVVVNPATQPSRVITAFFDRRMKGPMP